MVRLTDTITVLKDIQAKSEARLTKIEERLEEHDRKFNEILAEIARLREDQNRLRQDMKDEFAKVWEEITRLREDMNKGFSELRREVGILSEKLGFTLEDIAVTRLPRLLQEDGIMINRRDIRVRHIIVVDSKEVEVDIYAEGMMDGKKVRVIGEVKVRIGESDVNRFYNRFKGYDAYKFLFGYTIRPRAEDRAEELGIRLYATYN